MIMKLSKWDARNFDVDSVPFVKAGVFSYGNGLLLRIIFGCMPCMNRAGFTLMPMCMCANCGAGCHFRILYPVRFEGVAPVGAGATEYDQAKKKPETQRFRASF